MRFATYSSTLALLASAALVLAAIRDQDGYSKSLLPRQPHDKDRSNLHPRADAAAAAGLSIPAKCKEWVDLQAHMHAQTTEHSLFTRIALVAVAFAVNASPSTKGALRATSPRI